MGKDIVTTEEMRRTRKLLQPDLHWPELYEFARAAMERDRGSTEAESPDSAYDEAYTLAFNALFAKGVDRDIAQAIATHLGQSVAQP